VLAIGMLNRPYFEQEKMVGDFISPLPLPRIRRDLIYVLMTASLAMIITSPVVFLVAQRGESIHLEFWMMWSVGQTVMTCFVFYITKVFVKTQAGLVCLVSLSLFVLTVVQFIEYIKIS